MSVRFTVVLVALAIGCAPRVPREPQPPVTVTEPAEAVPSPSELCDHVRALAKVKGKEKELSGCLSKAETLRAEQPERYACLAKCARAASNLEAVDGCEKKCPKPVDPDAEAYRNLGAIETGAKARFQEETDTSENGLGPFVHRHCPSSKAPIPATLQAPGAAHPSAEGEWDAPTWRCLRFSLSGPLYFQYSYEWNGKDGVDSAYVATARRRLPNGKTRVITLRAKGTVTGETERISLTTADE